MPEYKALAKRLRRIRKQMNETQAEFAWNCGISTEEIGLIENEKTNPKLATLSSIAAYTGLSISELLEITSDEETE